MKTKQKRRKKIRYEPLLQLPPLSREEYQGLYDSIAVHGVLNAILVDSDGPKRRIIDGNHRKEIADDLGYDCPEVVHEGEEEELRTLARALNLARRHLTTEQKRAIVADQLRETPDRTNRVIAKLLGVSHPTVASVRADLESVGKIYQQGRRIGTDGKTYKPTKGGLTTAITAADRKARLDAVTLLHGDCRRELRKIGTGTVDAVISDPPYPCIDRDYGRLTEAAWQEMMRAVVGECRRVLKPTGSAMFILQPNCEQVGRMRPWLWKFVAWAAEEWNLVQDVYWWCINALPSYAAGRKCGLLRRGVRWCVWLGPPDCYRNQDSVLWDISDDTLALKWEDRCLRHRPSGHRFRRGRTVETAVRRGGSTPFNLLPVTIHTNRHGHPAVTPYEVADWWCRYILPPGGVLLDPFVGSGTTLAAGLNNGASKAIGIDKEARYLRMATRRVREG